MRNRHLLALASAFILVGQGCIPAPAPELPSIPPDTVMAPDNQAMMKKDEDAPTKKDGALPEAPSEAMMKPELKPYYVTYGANQAETAKKEGRATVLYFWAAWCPICRAEEPNIKGWIEGSGLPIAGFRVNYDTETELKAVHKVSHQHTTVFLDAEGVEVERFIGPVSQSEFVAALEKTVK